MSTFFFFFFLIYAVIYASWSVLTFDNCINVLILLNVLVLDQNLLQVIDIF